ncbi:hypothetical protein CWO85_01850 [Candidatus Phytoplasma ziziphi]|uniref:Exonuclease VII large subunit C-terminal domain-containing protein n=1 Tax=Ziziphus jujuba witches'-broom phytoplasma TaxID=135727 RepID=A0A660HNC1_ZIZJU|nr:exodeoxyribonuclease VII large subunit [Candidatus Phytoplasma ziziphi]AYJ01266.1 hypothetical protein CWO85_01850 [Candidatus Phytoplasma ziziphi]
MTIFSFLRSVFFDNKKNSSLYFTKKQLNANDLLEINDLLARTDDLYNNKKTPFKLINGVIKESKNHIYLHSVKDINKKIIIEQIENIDPKMFNQDVIVEGQLIRKNVFKNKYFVLKINNWLLKKDINKYNLQTQVQISKIMKIGILVSENSSVYSDIQGILKEKNYKSYKTYYARMEKDKAILEIIKTIKQINDENEVDVIILSRGGGELKEINRVFNNKCIIENIKNSKIPIITGIGHAANITFSDLVAFDYGITPTSSILKIFAFIEKSNNYLYQQNTLETYFPFIFKVHYKNKQMNNIKKIIGVIDKNKFPNLQLNKLFYNLKTNYNEEKNVLYYNSEDNEYIKFFLIRTRLNMNYKNEQMNYIKKIIEAIDIDELQTVQFHKLLSDYKTNYNQEKNIIYYNSTDTEYIKFFLINIDNKEELSL